ncbi:hypothetical protein PCE1_000823 [Barthelona sp. PCE]
MDVSKPTAEAMAEIKAKHKFWSTQLVPQPNLEENNLPEGPIKDYNIESNRADIRPIPYNLPGGFSWGLININDEEELESLFRFLEHHYVEDDLLRFRYSKKFLKYALSLPNMNPEYVIVIRDANNNIVGSITGSPAHYKIRNDEYDVVEVNFLCVKKELRNHRITPVLIKELTRRCNINGIFQAVYTAGKPLPRPFLRSNYYHRLINIEKLIDVGFYDTKKRIDIEKRIYALPDVPVTDFRPVDESDLRIIVERLNEYQRTFEIARLFTVEEARHLFLPIDDVVSSYVWVGERERILGFASWTLVDMSVLENPNHDSMRVAYLNYHFLTDFEHFNCPKPERFTNRKHPSDVTVADLEACEETITTLNFEHEPFVNSMKTLIEKSLIHARDHDECDVFNCLDNLYNSVYLEDLMFLRGSGKLHYYLFNYRVDPVTPVECGALLY